MEVVVDNEIKLLTLANMSHPKKDYVVVVVVVADREIGNRIYTRRKKKYIYITES